MSEKYSNFVSTTDLDARKEENKKTRQNILEQAKKKYEREEAKKEKARKSGEGSWMLDSISQRIQNDSKKLKKAKKKKSKKEKKKKRQSSSSASEEDEDSDNKWVEVSKTDNVENLSIKGPKIQRESWMESPLDLIPTTSRQELRDIVKKQKDEANKEAERLLQPGQHARELNPYWRDGGTGLPSSGKQSETDKKSESSSSSSHHSKAGDGGLAWLRQAYIRCKQQAVDEGRSLEEVTAERWGSLKKLESMLAEAERKHKNQHTNNRAEDIRGDRDEKRHNRHRECSPSRKGNDHSSHDFDKRDRDRDGHDDRSRLRFQRPGSDEEDHREMSSGRSRQSTDVSRDSKGDKPASALGFRLPKSDSEEDGKSSRKPSFGDMHRKGKEGDREERLWYKPILHLPRWKKSLPAEENEKDICEDRGREEYREKDRHEPREKGKEENREKCKNESREKDRHESREKDRDESKKDRQHKKSNREKSRRKYSSSSSSGSSDSDGERDVPDIDAQQKIEVKVATEEELNNMAAKILRAEIMGNDTLALELKENLEKARKLREASKAQGGDNAKDFSHARKDAGRGQKKREEDDGETDNVVILSRTSKRGVVRPVVGSSDPWGGGHGKKRKRNVQTHDIAGQRTIYFDDDDKLDLKALVEQEKAGTAEDQNSMFSRLAGKSNDKDLDVDDMFVSKAARKQDAEKVAAKDRSSAIFEHKKMSSAVEKCQRCLQKVPKHLIIAIGTKSYLCLPHHRSLTEGHCLIVPMQHVLSATSMDEDIWREMQMFRQSLVRMFKEQDQDVVFMETVMHLKHFPHTALECVPLDREQGDLAPIYFKKAIQDAGPEWSDNKKLHSLKGKDVRRVILLDIVQPSEPGSAFRSFSSEVLSMHVMRPHKLVPKGFPYFSVDFGLEGGYATVIEDEVKFPAYFGREIVGGMIDAEPMLWRHPHKQSFEDQRQKVLKFEQMWKPFDWTQNLTSAD